MPCLPLLELLLVLKLVQKLFGYLVLSLDKGLCLLRVEILQPVVRIGNGHAVLGVGDIGSEDLRVDNFAVQGGAGGSLGIDHGHSAMRR